MGWRDFIVHPVTSCGETTNHDYIMIVLTSFFNNQEQVDWYHERCSIKPKSMNPSGYQWWLFCKIKIEPSSHWTEASVFQLIPLYHIMQGLPLDISVLISKDILKCYRKVGFHTTSLAHSMLICRLCKAADVDYSIGIHL